MLLRGVWESTGAENILTERVSLLIFGLKSCTEIIDTVSTEHKNVVIIDY